MTEHPAPPPEAAPEPPDVIAAREAAAARRKEAIERVTDAVLRVVPILAIAAATFLTVLRVIHERGAVVDEAFILARYAANLGAGHGFRWNATSPPCEGFTSTTYVVLLAIAGKLGAGPLGAAAALGAAAVTGIVTLLSAVARPRSPWFGLAAIPAFFFVTNTGTVVHASRGLETVFFAMLCLLTIVLTGRAVRRAALSTTSADAVRRRAALLAAASAFLCVLTRPEGALVAVVCGVVAVILLRRDRAALRALLPAGLALSAAVAVWVLWKLVYFGDIFPTAYYVKAAPPGWNGTAETLAFLVAHWPILAAALAASLWAWRRELTAPQDDLPVAPAPFACLAFPLVAAPWLVHSAHTVHEMGFAHRFAWPVVAVACLSVASALGAIPTGGVAEAPGVASIPARSVRRGASLAFAVVAVVVSGEVRGAFAVLRDTPRRDPYVATFAEIGHAVASVGKGEEIRVVTHAPGALPYYSGAHHVDLGGLATAEFSTRVPEDERMRLALTIPFDVNVTVFPPAQEGAASIGEDAAVLDPYMAHGILRMGPDVVRRGVIADAARWPVVVHDQMRMLRDRATLAAMLTLPGGARLYVHVAKDSPHRAALLAALSKRGANSGGNRK